MRRKAVWTAVAVFLGVASGVFAEVRGMGRITGTVRDGGGTPVAGVTVTATLKGAKSEIEATTDDKGLWAVYGVGKGEWHVEFHKAGYTPVAARVTLEAELSRVPPIAITLKRDAGGATRSAQPPLGH